MELNEILSRLEGVRGSGGQYTARCPAHDDRHNSLAVAQGTKGIVLHCYAGCEPETVADAMGLEMKDLYTTNTQERRSPRRAPATLGTTRSNYPDEDGTLLYYKYRFDKEDGSKSCGFYKPDGTKGVEGVKRVP